MPTHATRRRLAPAPIIACAGAALIAGAGLLLAPDAEATSARATAQDTAEGAFTVDRVHSNVNFRVLYQNSSHFFGRFNEMEGSYLVDPDNTDDSFINLTIKTDSVDTANDGRDQHLRRGDFFASRQYPEATFVSTAAERVDDDTIRFTGDFTLRGVTNEITVDVDRIGSTNDPRAQKLRSGWLATFTFNRSDFNVSYGLGGLSDETELTVSITGLQN